MADALTPSLELLTAVAQDFRRALELYLSDKPHVSFVSDPNRTSNRFPHDCCKSASVMLGYVLSTHVRRETLRYVSGKRGVHGWLECGAIWMDVTPDQFDDQDQPVVVVAKSESEWHVQRFSPYRTYPWNLRRTSSLVSHAEGIMSRMKSLGPLADAMSHNA